MDTLDSSVTTRFWTYVEKTPICWLWTGSVKEDGSGLFSIKRHKHRAHRLSYLLHYGAIPSGMYVQQSCGVPRCVFPGHLFLGTHFGTEHTPLSERFWKYVQKTETCWLWTGATMKNGYGVLHVGGGGGITSVHRFSYEMHSGCIPEGLYVLHHCDVRHCVRPEHLFLGTHLDNIRDMVEKKRHSMGQPHPKQAENFRKYFEGHSERRPRGEQHWSHRHPERLRRGEQHWTQTKPERIPRGRDHHAAKLTEDQVREIRQRYQEAQGRRGILKELAAFFPVCRANLSDIVQGKTWTHLLDEA